MTPLFNISSSSIDHSRAQLFIEIGEYGLSFNILNEENEFSAVRIYQFADKLNSEKEIQNILYQEPLFKEKYKKVNIIYSFSESVLVPKELANQNTNSEMLELVYGNFADKIIRSDFMYKLNVQNIYRIPNAIDNAVNNQFPVANVTHIYSILPDVVKDRSNCVYAIFSPNHIIVLLLKDGKLQVIQNFTYQIAEDAAYYLLSVCKSFNADLNETNLLLAGMIDASSPLYAELYKYFLQIEFAALPDRYKYSEEIKNYPDHFFSHLFSITACV